MVKGKVKWFDTKKGFGFARVENEQQDIFIHYSKIRAKGFKNLFENQDIELEYEKTQKGLLATRVIAYGKPIKK